MRVTSGTWSESIAREKDWGYNDELLGATASMEYAVRKLNERVG